MENNESMGRHTVTIEDRKRIKINCVEDVESFNEEKVVVYTSMGVDVYKRQVSDWLYRAY